MHHALPDHLPPLFSHEGLQDPFPTLAWLVQHDPVHWDPQGRLRLVTGYDEITEALRSKHLSAEGGQRGRGAAIDMPPSMLNTDGQDHQRLRAPAAALLGPSASARLVEGAAPRIREIIGGLHDEIDPLQELGIPCATAVFGTMLELDDSAREEFQSLAAQAAQALNPAARGATARSAASVMPKLSSFVGAHLDAAAQDTPLRRLSDDARISRSEKVGILNLSIVGGWQPLADLIVNGLPLLLAHRAELADADLSMFRVAEDEFLRLHAPIPMVSRVTTSNVVIGGCAVSAGTRVVLMLAAANRDPQVFACSTEVDLTRASVKHLAFGAGTHYCMGARLVRESAALVHQTLLQLHPKMSSAADAWSWQGTLMPRRIVQFRLINL